MTTSRKLNVFLCHASLDKPAVRELNQRLKQEGWIEPWLDEDKIFPGQEWEREIEKAVETADAVIIFLSNNSVTKEGYIQRELRYVMHIADCKPEGTVFLIPVRLEDCRIPRSLSMWQYVDYFPEDNKDWAYERLLNSLTARAEALSILPKDPAPEQDNHLGMSLNKQLDESKPLPESEILSQGQSTQVEVTSQQEQFQTTNENDRTATNPNGKGNPEGNDILKNSGRWLSGFLTLFLLTLLINQALSLKLFFPERLIDWISTSSDPKLALWAVSILSASALIILLKLGRNLPFLESWEKTLSHPIFSYLLGLHTGLVFMIVLLSTISLVYLRPVCQAPIAVIDVHPIDRESILKFDGKSMAAKTGAEMILGVMVSDDTVFFCEWIAKGPAIGNLRSQPPCSARLNLSEEPGRGMVTLRLSKGTCALTSIEALEIITVP